MNTGTEAPELLKTSGSTGRLKVARIFGRLSLGGATRQVCYLHGAMRDRFDTVLIVGSPERDEADMSGLLETSDGVYRVETIRRPLKFWQDLRSLLRIWKILRAERPDIVHTHCSKAGALGRIAAALAGTPVRLHTYHGHVFSGHFGPLKSAAYIWIERVLNRLSTSVIAISETQARDLSEVYRVSPPDKIAVVRTGFDLQPFASCDGGSVRSRFGIPKKKVLIVWAGRFAEVKNLPLLAEVIRISTTEIPEAYFLLVGDGPDGNRMRNLTQGLANVTMTGVVENMPRVWAAADIALLTSRSEGTPATMVEAMAAATPFISTEVGGVVDLTIEPRVRDPETSMLWTGNALLTPADASVMVNALRALVTNPRLRHSMGVAGQQFVLAHHTSERLLADMEALYFRLYALKAHTPEQEAPLSHECSH